MFKEIRSDLQEAAENYVIQKCKESYSELLMKGPFSHHEQKPELNKEPSATASGRNKKAAASLDHIDIPDRPRCTAMGVVLHQVDSSSSLVTAVIVDKYGEVIDHLSFTKLLMPRSLLNKGKPPPQGKLTEEAELRNKKLAIQQKEEEAEYQRDCDRLI